jgi:flagellar biogenesis protein FliO
MVLGFAMIGVGTYLIVRFYRGRGAQAPEVASPTAVETIFVGVILTSIGTLVFVLGLTGVICRVLGVAM